ncbi:hypothetical protein EON64_15865 [archaeon]|nr:MAG: hypothetical protein EON64_15865 [archaeon]
MEELVAEVHLGMLGLEGDRGSRLLGCVIGAGVESGVGLATLRKYLEQKLKAEVLGMKDTQDDTTSLSEGECALLLAQVLREVEEERGKGAEEMAAEILKREMEFAIESVLQGLDMKEQEMLRTLQPGES